MDELESHANEVVAARGEGLALRVAIDEGEDGARADMTHIDLPLVEEVLDNLLSNACGHAKGVIEVEISVREGRLALSENNSAEHFGLGLNVSSILCGLHGGALELGNGSTGGARVTATFSTGGDGDETGEL